MHEVNLTSAPEAGAPVPFQFPSIDGCFPIASAKAIAIAPGVSQSPPGACATTACTSADLPIPGSAPRRAPLGPSTEPVQTPRDSDQDVADQRTGRSHRTPEVNFAIRPGNRADATISRSVDRRMFPAMTSSSIIARATCPPGAVAQNSSVYLLQPVKGIR